MRKFKISANLVGTIEQLYDKATGAVHMNGSMGKWLRTTVGILYGYFLSFALYNTLSNGRLTLWKNVTEKLA